MQQLCSRIVLRPTCVTFRYLLGLFQAPLLDSSSFWLLSAVADTFGVQWLLLVHVTDTYRVCSSAGVDHPTSTGPRDPAYCIGTGVGGGTSAGWCNGADEA